MNIVLTGFMATGKTVISKELAKLLDRKLLDTDEMIVEAAQMSINDIFAKHGEEYFRQLEKEIIKKASEAHDAVISTGGGVVLNADNIEQLRINGKIVNLSPEFEVIKERIELASKTRPLMKGKSIEEIEKLFNYRKPFYDNCDVKIKITNNKSPKEYAEEIIKVLGDDIK